MFYMKISRRTSTTEIWDQHLNSYQFSRDNVETKTTYVGIKIIIVETNTTIIVATKTAIGYVSTLHSWVYNIYIIFQLLIYTMQFSDGRIPTTNCLVEDPFRL